MNLDQRIACACELVPGLVLGALALLPEGLLIGGVGEGGAFDREPLVRSAVRCLAAQVSPSVFSGASGAFAEYALVCDERQIVVLQGARLARVALVLVCSREANLALVMHATRAALDRIEEGIDLAEWEG